MKLITAVVGAFKLDPICEALEKIGIRGMTVTEVAGTGRQLANVEFYKGVEMKPSSIPKVKLDIAVCDDIADRVMELVIDAARTGRVGDGKIFVTDIEEVVRIRNGKRGPDAI